ncbi:hypothetical protein ABPG72_012785 [Tetrahymena utriculariae]
MKFRSFYNLFRKKFSTVQFAEQTYFQDIKQKCQRALINENPRDSAFMIQKIFKLIDNNQKQLKDEIQNSKISNNYQGQTYGFPENVQSSNVKDINQFLKDNKISKKIQLLHSLAHIEYNAMKSYLDTSIRFLDNVKSEQKFEFFKDIMRVSCEESEHFILLSDRLSQDSIVYGDIPVHTGLIDNVKNSINCPLTRIALISIVQEGKGVDSGDRLLVKLISFQDKIGAKILQRILDEEVGHIGVGNKWFQIICKNQNLDPIIQFKEICQNHGVKFFKPYNKEARIKAGYDEDWIQKIWEEN